MQRYDLIVAREGKEGKVYWTKVGSGFPARSGEGFSLLFDALPLPGKDGSVWVQMRIPQERTDSPRPQRAAQSVTSGAPPRSMDDDDQIPFAPEWR